jgi:hypothetical protein
MPEKRGFRPLAALTALAALSASGCFSLRIQENVNDPSPYFQRAYAQIEKIHQNDPERAGHPHRLYLLIYDGAERKLVKMGLPLWVVEAGLKPEKDSADCRRRDFQLGHRYNIAWRSIIDVSQLGPGLLVEVVDEKAKILIWLK